MVELSLISFGKPVLSNFFSRALSLSLLLFAIIPSVRIVRPVVNQPWQTVHTDNDDLNVTYQNVILDEVHLPIEINDINCQLISIILTFLDKLFCRNVYQLVSRVLLWRREEGKRLIKKLYSNTSNYPVVNRLY